MAGKKRLCRGRQQVHGTELAGGEVRQRRLGESAAQASVLARRSHRQGTQQCHVVVDFESDGANDTLARPGDPKYSMASAMPSGGKCTAATRSRIARTSLAWQE